MRSLTARERARGEINIDNDIIFTLTLSVLFFGCIIWLIIHVRRQESLTNALKHQEAKTPKPPVKKRVA